MKEFDSTNRFPISLTAEDLRILKLGLSALQGTGTPINPTDNVSCPDRSLGSKAASLLQRLSDVEEALQSTPLPPYIVDEQIYSAEELSQIRKVISVFAAFLSTAESLYLFWSRDGLICLGIDSGCSLYDPERYYVRLVGNGEELCVEILRHLAQDVLERENLLGEQYTYYHEVTDPVSKAAVAEAARPYLEQLPEYPDVLPKIYRDLY